MSEFIMNTYSRFPGIFVRGNGVYLYDDQGKEYMDFIQGVAVNCLGHASPVISNTLAEQSKKLIHLSNFFWSDTQLKLAERMTSLSDHQGLFFCNSGTEAIETALKIGRKHGKMINENKYEIIYTKNSFHGRTMGALAVTGQEKYQKDFAPLIGGVVESIYNDIESLESKFNENTSCFIVEPIQGEGGVVAAEKAYLQKARELCDKYDALLIFDEVQTGIGRLGTFFAYQKFGVIPDLICMAKGLGGGFPVGAVLGNEKASKVLVPGDQGNTFGGNPLACAVANAVIGELVDNGVLQNVNEMSSYLYSKLEDLKAKYPSIVELRGKGLLVGIAFEFEAKEFTKTCFEKGLLLATAGPNVARILPPLNIKKEEIDKLVLILDDVLSNFKLI